MSLRHCGCDIEATVIILGEPQVKGIQKKYHNCSLVQDVITHINDENAAAFMN